MEVDTIFDFIPPVLNSQYNPLLIFSIIALIMIVLLTWLLKTDFGIAMRATGNNEQMVRAFGINTDVMKVTGLALANALTAMSGFLLVQYQGYADINMGIGIVISGLAAVMMGESLSRLTGMNRIGIQIVFVIVGSILFRLILAFTLSMGLNPNYLKLITAVIVLLVVAINRLRKEES